MAIRKGFDDSNALLFLTSEELDKCIDFETIEVTINGSRAKVRRIGNKIFLNDLELNKICCIAEKDKISVPA